MKKIKLNLFFIISSLLLFSCNNKEINSNSIITTANQLTSEELINQKVNLFIQSKQELKNILNKEIPNIELDSPLVQSIKIRNLVHQKTNIYNLNRGDLNNPVENIKSILNQSKGHLCAGMSFTFQTLLFSLGIESRYVGLFDNKTPTKTHAVAEILIDNKWIAVDTTYNTMFIDSNGNYLNYFEMKELRDKGEPFFFEQNGMVSVSDYLNPNVTDIGISSYLNYIARFPSSNEDKIIFSPNSWTGDLYFPNYFQIIDSDFYLYLRLAYKKQ